MRSSGRRRSARAVKTGRLIRPRSVSAIRFGSPTRWFRLLADPEEEDDAPLGQAAAAEQHDRHRATAQPRQQRRYRDPGGETRHVVADRAAVGGIEEVDELQAGGRLRRIGADAMHGAGEKEDHAVVVDFYQEIGSGEGDRDKLVALRLVVSRLDHGPAAEAGSRATPPRWRRGAWGLAFRDREMVGLLTPGRTDRVDRAFAAWSAIPAGPRGGALPADRAAPSWPPPPAAAD